MLTILRLFTQFCAEVQATSVLLNTVVEIPTVCALIKGTLQVVCGVVLLSGRAFPAVV